MCEATRLRRVEGFDWRALDIWVLDKVAQKAGDDHIPFYPLVNGELSVSLLKSQ